jgi:hypothetical protein
MRRRRMTMSERLLGYCDVDSGKIYIGDPSYVGLHDVQSQNYVGFVVPSGLGDGTYPVTVTEEEIEGRGKRITSMVINFFPEEDVDED